MKLKTIVIVAVLFVAGSWASAQQPQGSTAPNAPAPGMGGQGGMSGMMCGDMMGQGGGGGMMGMMGGGGRGGMMGGGGGMMGMMGEDMMGPGMMGASPERLALDPRIPPEKRSQIRDLTLSMTQGMVSKSAELQNQRLAMMKAAHAFPIDQQAVKSAREGMQRAMGEMVALRMETMGKIQQILGKDLWEQVHPGWYGPRPGSGPAQPPPGEDPHGHSPQDR